MAVTARGSSWMALLVHTVDCVVTSSSAVSTIAAVLGCGGLGCFVVAGSRVGSDQWGKEHTV
jgi:ABC-type proline/glycine betaine transport system permease subunit